MENKLHISLSPHIHSNNSTMRTMLDVIIALVPASIAAVILFGIPALLVIAVCVISAVAGEALFNLAVKKEQTVGDLSAVVTGLILALNLPSNIPLWQAAVGSLFAIVIVKGVFGGLGKNIVNPALAGRAFMFSWPVAMSTWVKVGISNAAPVFGGADIVTAATPLSFMHQGQMPNVTVAQAFFGNVGGYTLVSKPPFIRPQCQMVTEKGTIIKKKETFEEVFHTYA
mgnify:CR=1 FL=1